MKPNHKLCVVITGPTLEDAQYQMSKTRDFADIFEFRLDLFSFTELKKIALLQECANLPVIFTLRKYSQGGKYAGNENDRLDAIRELISLQPEYLDLESDVSPDFFEELAVISPRTEIICSWHDFEKTPDHLQLRKIFNEMQQCKAHLYKIATMAHSTLDALCMLSFVKENSAKGHRLMGMCMGYEGQATRTLGPIFGNEITYAAWDVSQATAPGQLDALTLHQVFNHKRLNSQTQIYGLIGNPVSHSKGDIGHNAVYRELNLNAIYIKIPVIPEELPEFLERAKALNFHGLSVTMPLKEKVLEHVNLHAQENSIGAINTLQFSSKEICGYNYDGKAVIEILLKKTDLQNKKVVLLGAGGSAKAIAYELHKHGAQLIILNRTIEKSEELAKLYGGISASLDTFSDIAKSGYDVLINCTPVGTGNQDQCPIPPNSLLPNRIVMEIITRPKETLLVKEAKKRNCSIIYAYEMWIGQAVKQISLWFGDRIENQAKAILTKVLENG